MTAHPVLGEPDHVELIPRDLLFGDPVATAPKLSPDGTRLAFLAPVDGVLNVWVGDISERSFNPVTIQSDRPIEECAWARDNRHLLYLRDSAGEENHHCFAVDLDSGETRDLTPFDNVQARLLATSPRDPGIVVISVNDRDPAFHDVYRVDLGSGERELAAINPGFGGILDPWIIDSDLRVRGGTRPRSDGGSEICVRDTENDDWRVVYSVEPEEALTNLVATATDRLPAFSGDGKVLYLASSRDSEAGRLLQVDLASGDTTVLAEDPAYDIVGVHRHPETRQPQLATFVKERATHHVIDPSIAEDLAVVEGLQEGDFEIQGTDDADTTWLIQFTRDDGPGAWYAFDRTSRTGTKLFEDRPALHDYVLSRIEPFSYSARDGLRIHGYLTFPVGVEKRSLPTVLHVHGGPWGRDSWGWNPEAQWLANRGYLCVEVNYRGSMGYGKALVNAGDREWGGKMHDDLIDAVDHVVSRGWADPSKIAIYGASYGGYAALVGATFTPDLFRCAVSEVGPSNLITLLENFPQYWAGFRNVLNTRVGNPTEDRDFLWSRSPLSRVDQVKIPMLIGQGANDPRVTVVESEQIVAALRDRGIPHKYLLFEDEGHGFLRPENNLKWHAAVEQFLAEHLGGRWENVAGE